MRKLQFLNNVCILVPCLLYAICMMPLELSAADMRESVVYEKVSVTVGHEAVTLAPAGVSLKLASISDSSSWRLINYENRLHPEFGRVVDGHSCLYIGGPTGKVDTALKVISPCMDVTDAGRRWRLSFRMDSPIRVFGEAGVGDGHCSCVRWFGSDGRVIETVPFAFCSNPGAFAEEVVSGDVPDGAAKVEFSLGFDTPNIGPGQYVAFSDFSFELLGDEPKFVKTGSFVSDVLQGGVVSWMADVPSETALRFQFAAGETIDAVLNAPFRGPDGTSATHYGKPFAAEAKYVRIRVGLSSCDGNATPTLRCVRVGNTTLGNWTTRWNRPPRVRLVSPTTTTNRFEEICLFAEGDSILLLDSFSAAVDGTDVTAGFARCNGGYVFKSPYRGWSDGLHEVCVGLSDCRGNTVSAKRYFYVGNAPKATPHATLRDDGVVLVGGKPFFPVGIFDVRRRRFNDNNFDKAFRDLKAGGFNFVHTYLEYEPEFLAAAEKYGIGLFVRSNRGGKLPDDMFFRTGRHHPSIFAWYLADDTSNFWKPEPLKGYDSAVKAVDPTRLTCQADPIYSKWGHSRFADYVDTADVFMPEIYPLRRPENGDGSDKHCVAEVIRDMRRVWIDIERYGDGRKHSCWPIIQYFTSGKIWGIMPSRAQLFAMTWAAIIQGAQGMTWYTYGGDPKPDPKTGILGRDVTSTPESWATICSLATQISSLSNVLTERTPVQPHLPNVLSGAKRDPYGQPSVTCLLKHHCGRSYLFAVNSSPGSVVVRFTAEGLPSEVDTVDEGGRRVMVLDGTFSDAFDGFAVHIYTW